MSSDFEKAALAELKAIRLLLEQGAREREDLESRIRRGLSAFCGALGVCCGGTMEISAAGEAGPELYTPGEYTGGGRGDG